MSAEDDYSSLSKGVFLHCPKKRKTCSEYLSNSHVALANKQCLMWNDVWKYIDTRVQNLHLQSNTKILEDLTKFVAGSHAQFHPRQSFEDMKHEVPAAALVTGVNIPDHDQMFQTLQDLLTEQVTPFVVSLRSKDCLNIKNMISKAVAGLMNVQMQFDDDDPPDTSLNVKKVHPSFSVLVGWYNMKVRNQLKSSPMKSTPRKRPSKKGHTSGRCATPKYSPVVFIITDIEGFTAHVLQDFITICSSHLHELPVTLVLGVATSIQVLHRLLPHSVTSHLSIDKFLTPPSSSHLSQVLDQIILSPEVPFKLGGRVYNYLLDLFLFHEFSVLRYMQYLKFAVIDHFMSTPVSVLCVSYLTQQSCDLTPTQVQAIHQLPSFQRYITQQKLDEKCTSDQDLIWQLMDELYIYHTNYFPVLRCLHTFASKLPQHPLGKQLRQMYGVGLSKNIYETEDYKLCMKLIRNFSRDEILEGLLTCLNNLHLVLAGKPEELAKLQEFVVTLENIEDLQKQADEEKEKKEEPDKFELPKKTDLYTLRKKLQGLELQKKRFSVFETTRNAIVDYLDDMFRTYLHCPESMPLYEALYYNNVSELKQRVNATPRAAIQTALDDPFHYLPNDKLSTDEGEINSDMPNLCVAYKLHNECGRLINLYDWLQAFVTIKKDDEEPGENLTIDKVTHAGFIRSVSELQFLGFVKSTKRKTDHVARLTWGKC